jgi:thioredoxin reductase (NADPH)
MLDVLIVGAGPVGLACGIAAQREGLSVRIIEKGSLVNSIVGYPYEMEFFSTPELMEIGGHPFPAAGYKPRRREAIEYYRRVADAEGLDIRVREKVVRIEGEDGQFEVLTDVGTHACRKIVVAIGFFDRPNRLSIPGGDLPKVIHYYREPFPYLRQRALVVGAKNSAAQVALDLYRHGCDVTMAVRGPEISTSVKYWVRPDLLNRIKEGAIRAHFNTEVVSIDASSVDLKTPEGRVTLENDWVFAMTGYQPDFEFLQGNGIACNEDEFRTPCFDDEVYESNRAGIYLAGTVCGGMKTSRWFIENGRFHAARIMAHIARGDRTPVESERTWRTAE